MPLDIEAVMSKLQAAALDGMTDAMQHLLQEARTQTPIEEGTLERGGTATVDAQGDTIRGAVAFHGPYAARQHEEMTWRHDSGRKAKYLEDPMHTEASVMGDLVAARMRDALR